MTRDSALLRLLHLGSANLPVGAYAFSQGLEYAVEVGWVRDYADLRQWLSLQLAQSLTTVDIPILYRLHAALEAEEDSMVLHWNDFALACRETREMQLSDTAPGTALKRLLPALGVELTAGLESISFLTGFAHAAWSWKLDSRESALAFSWSWLENQIIAATKLLPLGQTRAQQILSELQAEIPAALDKAVELEDDELGVGLPGLALASMAHESQYTRLFRS